jgi:excisionase family DNA binding protein
MDTDALLSVEEAAKRLGGLSRWTVHAWLSQGKLRRTKVGGRTMIRESELARVIHEEDAPKSANDKGCQSCRPEEWSIWRLGKGPRSDT